MVSFKDYESRDLRNVFRDVYWMVSEYKINYNAFIKAMLCGNIKEMNAYMNEVALAHSAVLIQEVILLAEHSQRDSIMVLY